MPITILNLFNHCNNNMSPKNMSSKGMNIGL